MRSRTETGLLWKRLPDGLRGGGKSADQPQSAGAAVEDAEPEIVCRACGATITQPDQAISIAGAHRHTFANPHGIVFEIGCFRNAPGCAHVGPATDDFTWFAGYLWRIAICGVCHEHLGWRYVLSGQAEGFHGLIVDKLIFPS